MNLSDKILRLLLAGLALTAGGGGGNGGAFEPPQSGTITLTATTTTLPLNVSNSPWSPTSPYSGRSRHQLAQCGRHRAFPVMT